MMWGINLPTDSQKHQMSLLSKWQSHTSNLDALAQGKAHPGPL